MAQILLVIGPKSFVFVGSDWSFPVDLVEALPSTFHLVEATEVRFEFPSMITPNLRCRRLVGSIMS